MDRWRRDVADLSYQAGDGFSWEWNFDPCVDAEHTQLDDDAVDFDDLPVQVVH